MKRQLVVTTPTLTLQRSATPKPDDERFLGFGRAELGEVKIGRSTSRRAHYRDPVVKGMISARERGDLALGHPQCRRCVAVISPSHQPGWGTACVEGWMDVVGNSFRQPTDGCLS
jgi:hypothetical protein